MFPNRIGVGIALLSLIATVLSQTTTLRVAEVCRKYQPVTFVNTDNASGPTLRTYYDLTKEERIEEDYQLQSATIRDACYTAIRAYENSTDTNATNIIPQSNQLELLFAKSDQSKTFRYIIPVTLTSATGTTGDATLRSILDFLEYRSDTKGKFGFFTDNSTSTFTSVLMRGFEIPSGVFNTTQGCDGLNQPGSSDLSFNYDCLLGEEPFAMYFKNQMTYDWPLWFMVFIILSYVFIGNFMDSELPLDEAYKDNYKTFHPLYSVWHCGSEEIFTKRSRLTQIYVILCAIGFFNALMTTRYVEEDGRTDQSLALRLTVFPIFSIIFSIFSAYFTGFLLNVYYRCHRDYIHVLTTTQTHDEKKSALENYEAQSYRRLFVFYIAALLLSMFYLAMSIWFLYGYTLEDQGWWLLQVVIAVAFDWIVWDVLIVFLARISFLRSIFKIRGFWYDYDLHEEYQKAIKIA